MRELEGRVAFISGAGGGLGAGIARGLARRGVQLALADLQAGLLGERREEFRRAGVNCRTYELDVSDPVAVADAAARISVDLGIVTICVNNAGVGYVGAPADQVPLADYEWVFAVNLMGVVHGVRAFVPAMRALGMGGHVVNVASIDGLLPEPELHHAPYCASKAAVIAYSQALRNDLRPAGIGVSVVCPGLVQSALPESSRLRPARFGGAYERRGAGAFREQMDRVGMPADRAGEIVVEAILANRSMAFTHPDDRARVQAHHEAEIESAFAWSSDVHRRLDDGTGSQDE
jgi:NAD(P)-dependent dehydrogenase (short-subunit alcohol dehydrogenase family)